MSDLNKPRKITPLSGFPEWLPGVRQVELNWLDSIRKVFESYGYVSIETPSVETLSTLEVKGDIDKEVYILTKSHLKSKAEYGLHYDLTMPFARYVAQRSGDLIFPFKRYQIQKVWRGERPQRGRYREFYQCDIDVVNYDKLSPYYDLEVLFAGYEALKSLDIPPFLIEVSNRKIYEGYLEEIGIQNPISILRILDKIDKLGFDKAQNLIQENLGCAKNLV